MTRHLLAGAAAFALMTGVAFAADTESTTTTRSTTVPAVGNYQSSETHRGNDHDGYMARMKRFVHRNANGANGSTVSTKTRTTMPDGSRTTVREKVTPLSGSSIEKKTTTTIDR